MQIAAPIQLNTEEEGKKSPVEQHVLPDPVEYQTNSKPMKQSIMEAIIYGKDYKMYYKKIR